MMLLYYLEREREREYRGGSASFEANLRGEEKERITDVTTEREIFEFHMTSSIDQRRKKESSSLFFSFWESDLTFFESPLHNPTTTTAAAHARALNVLFAWSEVVYVV
jgi:hypothetical protein